MNINYDFTLPYRRFFKAFIYRPLYNKDKENE